VVGFTETMLCRLLAGAGFNVENVCYVAQYDGYLAPSKVLKPLFGLKYMVQAAAGLIRPSFCQNILITARPGPGQ
jgi:hypothetical protein